MLSHPPTLVEKLRVLGSLRAGDTIPTWLDIPNGWGPALSALANQAADEIERLRRELDFIRMV